jgi:hypothetical protein
MHDPKKQHPFEIVKDAVFATPMYFVTAMLNGDMARDLLLYNRVPKDGEKSTNRKPSLGIIREYSLVMLSGQWYLNPQPVILSEKHRSKMTAKQIEEMIDGQQRLMALVLAAQTDPGITVPFTLCFDAPTAAKWLLDQGKKRQPGDFFRMDGEANSGHLARAVRVLYAIEELSPFQSVNLWRHAKLTAQSQSEFLAKHEALRQGLEISLKMKNLIMPHIGGVLFYMVAREYGPFKAQELFNGFVSGANLSTEDARLKVREFIAIKNSPARGPRYRWDGFEQLAVLITATNAWLLGIDDYKAGLTFNKLASKVYPELMKASEMPTTKIVPGNDPNIG